MDRALLFVLAFLSMLAVTPLWADSGERPADATIIYLIQGSPPTATNVINTDHTITATATESVSGTPVVGFDVTFEVLTGPNAGTTGAGTTDSNGQATFTYTGSGGVGDDSIEICLFFSPPLRTGRPALQPVPLDCDTVAKTWIAPTPTATATPVPTATAVAASTTPSPTPVPSPTTTPAQLPVTGSGDSSSSLPWVIVGIAAFAALTLLAGATVLKRGR